MGYANTTRGAPWPPDARACPPDPGRYFANPDGNGIVMPPQTETTYILTNYWGIRGGDLRDSGGGFYADDGWTKFPLWVTESESGFTSETASNAIFYYMDYTWGGALSEPEEHWAKVGQYTIYRAKTSAQIAAFDLAVSTGDGQAPQGGRGYSPEVLERHGSHATDVGEALLAGTQPLNDSLRLSSYKAWDRAAMHRIAEGAELSAPKTQWDHGGHFHGQAESSILLEVRRALKQAGYSVSQIDWYLENGIESPSPQLINPWDLDFYGPDFSPQRGEETEPPESTEEKITVSPPAQTRLTVRAPVGYVPAASRHSSNRVEMVQSYKGTTNLPLSDKVDRFFFPITPNNISYSGLGSHWIEIPRKGHFPIVEWSDWVLMKVQFEFLLAHDQDGLFHHVSEWIEQLRRMAQRQAPVSIYGLDQLFRLQMKRAQTTGQAMQFVIADLSIKSAARTVLEGDKEITSAQCSITLQEIPIEHMTIVDMTIPPLSESALPPGDADDGDGGPPPIAEELDAINNMPIDGNITVARVKTTTVSGVDNPEYGRITVGFEPGTTYAHEGWVG